MKNTPYDYSEDRYRVYFELADVDAARQVFTDAGLDAFVDWILDHRRKEPGYLMRGQE